MSSAETQAVAQDRAEWQGVVKQALVPPLLSPPLGIFSHSHPTKH